MKHPRVDISCVVKSVSEFEGRRIMRAFLKICRALKCPRRGYTVSRGQTALAPWTRKKP